MLNTNVFVKNLRLCTILTFLLNNLVCAQYLHLCSLLSFLFNTYFWVCYLRYCWISTILFNIFCTVWYLDLVLNLRSPLYQNLTLLTLYTFRRSMRSQASLYWRLTSVCKQLERFWSKLPSTVFGAKWLW